MLILACSAVLVVFAPAPAQAPPDATAAQELLLDDQRLGPRVEPRPGDRCLVCDKAIQPGDNVYLVDGHRVGVHPGKCELKFRSNPRAALGALQPRGAFLGGQPGRDGGSQVWFFAGLYVLAGLLFGALCGHRALNAGHSTLGWFLAGFFFNAFGYLALLTRPQREDWKPPAGVPAGLAKIATTYSPQACACGAANHPSAMRCIDCGAVLTPQVASEVSRAGIRS